MLETYPIGRPTLPEQLDAAAMASAIERITALPDELESALDGARDLDHAIREGAWSIAQVVHHLADSHMHAFIRCKLALTADAPAVSSYDVDAWAHTPDARGAPVEPSLALLRALHARWVSLLGALEPEELERTWQVPARGVSYPLWRLPLIYAWHGQHHTAQIAQARAYYAV